MPNDSDRSSDQVQLDFQEVIETAEALSTDGAAAQAFGSAPGTDYDPIARTADYMRRAVQLEEEWGATIADARQALLGVDPVQLYLDFIADKAGAIRANVRSAARDAGILRSVCHRGMGMAPAHISIWEPTRGGRRWRVQADMSAIETHLRQHLVGGSFLGRT